MNPVVAVFRKLVGLKYSFFDLAIIQEVETKLFNSIISDYIAKGWDKQYEYDGVDAWIDHGKVKLAKGSRKLTFEWDNWMEGEIYGKKDEIYIIAARYKLVAKVQPTWFGSDT
ncbi:MAG: hypothetical protein ABJD02_12445 [Paraglaciecola sp.]|uniref:hypothetical protein n=1 Tax=Paraglaciecola sp. TaxID=1920173 RepID=UPI00326600A9